MVELPPKTAPRLFLIDGYALIYRAFFAFIQRPLTNSRGRTRRRPGASPTSCSASGRSTPGLPGRGLRCRNERQREGPLPDYKATREKMPEELEASLPRIRELVAGFGTTWSSSTDTRPTT
jgi:DNA polymerase I